MQAPTRASPRWLEALWGKMLSVTQELEEKGAHFASRAIKTLPILGQCWPLLMLSAILGAEQCIAKTTLTFSP